MENDIVLQNLNARGINGSVILAGLWRGYDAPRVALMYPDNQQALDAAAAEVLQGERNRDEQNTIAKVTSELSGMGVTSAQVMLDLQIMPANQVRVLAVEALSGDEAVRSMPVNFLALLLSLSQNLTAMMKKTQRSNACRS